MISLFFGVLSIMSVSIKYSCISDIINSYIHSWMYSYIHSFIHEFINSFFYSWVYPSIHPFIHSWVYHVIADEITANSEIPNIRCFHPNEGGVNEFLNGVDVQFEEPQFIANRNRMSLNSSKSTRIFFHGNCIKR